MNLETVLGVWAGLYLDGEIVSEANLQPYITDVLNELEFLTVSHKSPHCRLDTDDCRARHLLPMGL